MNHFEEENNLVKNVVDWDILLEFQLEHDIQIIRGDDYNYECWIDGKCYSQSLTPIGSLVFGINNFIG